MDAQQIRAWLANLPPCLIGMEACVGAHHLSRRLHSLGHNVRSMPAKYANRIAKGRRTIAATLKQSGNLFSAQP
jgi:transposase